MKPVKTFFLFASEAEAAAYAALYTPPRAVGADKLLRGGDVWSVDLPGGGETIPYPADATPLPE